MEVGEVQQNLHVELNNNLEGAVSVVRIVIRIVGRRKEACGGGKGLSTVYVEKKNTKQKY